MKSRFHAALAVMFFCSPLLFAQTSGALRSFNRGLDAQSDDNFYLASQYYLETVKENPAFADAWYRLAECSYKLAEFDLALQYLESAERLQKERAEYQNLRGMILVSMGRIDEGREIFNGILRRYPNDIDARFGLAEIEILEGRFTGAEKQYNEALRRQGTNRKALLSLALVLAERGDFSASSRCMQQALSFYSSDAEVHYIAAVINSMRGDFVSAEKQARIAAELNGDMEKAYNLLSTILYNQGRYEDVIDISDFLIRRNRENSNAWFIKGISQSKLKSPMDAVATWTTGLSISPQDEMMRYLMETEIRNTLSLEDSQRSFFAAYHIENARQYASRYEGAGASYEYQRALVLDPMNVTARLAFADLLELNGMHELYLDQLEFIKEHSYEQLTARQKTELDDKIEAYEDLLADTLGKKWGVEPFYLDKTRWSIAIFYEENPSGFIHADSNRIVAQSAADIFSGVAITSVKTQVTPVSGYGEAFRNARNGKFDFFVILSLSEGGNELTLKSTMYSGRTGLEVTNGTFYSTGNNRFSTVLRRFRNSVLEKLTVRGKILRRNGKTVLVDLGKAENVVAGAEFAIVKKGGIRTADSGAGLYYLDTDVLGTLLVTRGGEEISEGELQNYGFYDRINPDDEVVLVSMPKKEGSDENPVDTVPAADAGGNPVVELSVGEDIVAEIRKAVERPSILNLLREIY